MFNGFIYGKIGKIYSPWAHAIFYMTPPLLHFLFRPHVLAFPNILTLIIFYFKYTSHKTKHGKYHT